MLVLLLVLSIAALGLAADSTFVNECPDNEPVPCGIFVDGSTNSEGATYRFQGVTTGLPLAEIVDTDAAAAAELTALFGESTSVTFSRFIYDVTFISGLTKGCKIDDVWRITTAWSPTSEPQCSLSGPCTVDTCFDIDGPNGEHDVPVSGVVDNVFYTTPTGAAQYVVPFDVIDFQRSKRGTAPNDDLEDDNTVYMVGGDGDDFDVSGDGTHATNVYDDDNDDGLATLCDDDNFNDCASGRSSELLASCFGDFQGYLALYAYGHPYTTGFSDDYTCAPSGATPGVDDNCYDNCKRSLNPGNAFGFSITELYNAYETGDFDGCDVTTADENGCLFGGNVSIWDVRIHGDDDDDDNVLSGSQLGDDDDDDDSEDDGSCLAIRGDGTVQSIHADALLSQLAAVRSGDAPLTGGLYNHLATGANGIHKPSADGADYYTTATCGNCHANSNGHPRAKAERYIQYSITPNCHGFEVLTTGTFADHFRCVWTGEVEIGDEAYSFSAEYANGAMQRSRSVTNTDATSDAFGSTISITMGDSAIFAAPTGIVEGQSSVYQCFGETDPAPLSDPLEGGVFPFVTTEGTCNGCTSMQETGQDSDQRLWFILNQSSNDLWYEPCGYAYEDQGYRGYSGYHNGCLQSSDFFSDTEVINTGQSTLAPMDICQDAFTSGIAIMCRPDASTNGDTVNNTPAGLATANNNWYQRVLSGEFTSPEAMNAAWRTTNTAQHASGPGYRPAISPNIWFYNGVVEGSPYVSALNFAGEEWGVPGDSTAYEDDGEAVSFRMAFYLPSTMVTLGDTLLSVSATGFSAASVGVTSLCPPTYADPIPSACSINGPYAVASDAEPYCGYTFMRAEFSAPSGTATDATFTIRFNFDACNAVPNQLFQTCPTSDSVCAAVVSSQITFQLGDSTALDLANGASLLFFSTAATPSCSAECPISVEQQLGGEWVEIGQQTVPSCYELSESADRGACAIVDVSPTPSPSATTTTSVTTTTSATATLGSLPSATSTNSATPTQTATNTPTLSASSTVDAPGVASSSPLPPPVITPGVNHSTTPSPTPSPSSQDLAMQTSACDTCDLACKCGPDGDAAACMTDPCGLISIVVLTFVLMCMVLTCCVCVYGCAHKYKKSKQA